MAQTHRPAYAILYVLTFNEHALPVRRGPRDQTDQHEHTGAQIWQASLTMWGKNK